MRAVGNLRAADEPLEQSDARAEKILVAVRLLDRHAQARDSRIRRRAVAFNRGSARRADGHQCGGPGRRT